MNNRRAGTDVSRLPRGYVSLEYSWWRLWWLMRPWCNSLDEESVDILESMVDLMNR